MYMTYTICVGVPILMVCISIYATMSKRTSLHSFGKEKNITCVRSDIRLGEKSDDFLFNTLEMISYLIRKVMISYLIY